MPEDAPTLQPSTLAVTSGRPPTVSVADLCSTNGTVVNGQRVG